MSLRNMSYSDDEDEEEEKSPVYTAHTNTSNNSLYLDDDTDDDASVEFHNVVPVPRGRPEGNKRTALAGERSMSFRMPPTNRNSIRVSLSNAVHTGVVVRSRSNTATSVSSAGGGASIGGGGPSFDENIHLASGSNHSRGGSVVSSGGGGGAEPAHREMLVRQQSWYKDLMAQGMSAEEIAELLGEGAVEHDNTPSSPDNNNPSALLEQHSIMAYSEARRRLTERMGHDPWESKPPQPTTSTNSTSTSETTPQQLMIFPDITASSASTTTTKPSKIISKPTRLFPWNPQPFMDQRQMRISPTDLMPGRTVSKTATAAPKCIHVKCLGCRQVQSVSYQATLVRCAACSTVSPACSSILC